MIINLQPKDSRFFQKLLHITIIFSWLSVAAYFLLAYIIVSPLILSSMLLFLLAMTFSKAISKMSFRGIVEVFKTKIRKVYLVNNKKAEI